MRHSLLSAVALFTCLAVPAQAQTACGPLTRAFSLDLTPGPGGARYGVPISVNGKQKQFLLNTGTFNSRLGRSTVSELNLSPKSLGRRLADNGAVLNAYVVTADVQIGPMKAPGHEMWVEDGPAAFDGMLAPDLMQNYDIEMDFAGGKLNYFLTDHCPGRVVYWATSGVTSVEFKGWDNNARAHGVLMVPVLLDGHEIYAEVDSSRTQSVLDADTASALFKLSPDSPGAVPMGALDANPAHRLFNYTFQTLKIGGMTIRNPKLQVMPDLIGKVGTEMLRADSRVQRHTDEYLPSIQIGMDVLRRLHLYIAAEEKRIYFTAAAGQTVNAVPPPGATAAAPAETAR